ncbi:MAG TPA: TonB-dependent receptor [Longimicrobium sp.]|jgi:iron complex outermembrane receptor protein|uniref:TonB-dependent receptor n=1 Tax=Longimicrobium sp. TaxID=2029185 RepID=UPI002EDB3A44
MNPSRVQPSHARTHRPRRLLYAAALLLAAVFAPGLAAQNGTLTGRVTDAGDGAPLSGAVVRLGGGPSATTGANGTYRLEAPAGSYEVTVTRLGFSAARGPVRLTAGETTTLDLALFESAQVLEAVVAVGTRRPDRTVTDATVPVDVLTAADIQATGLTETAQIIQRLAPSVNFPRATVSDGTDHVRPATLRGLAPDQVLVLVNGKRRHNSALVNVNGSVGRGSTAVDLNAIPASAIERIEILRDGAAAQYGSDAIAGVINIVLKQGGRREALLSAGQTTEGDGRVLQLAGTGGRDFGEAGFVSLSVELRDRENTNRSLPDTRQQYFPGDPRNNNRARVNHRQGDSDSRDAGLFLNAAVPLGPVVEAYAFGGLSRRDGEAAGFFRRANDARTVRSIHPDGFLPLISTTIVDGSGVAGVRGTAAGFRYDLSGVYGRNTFAFDVLNSNNVSMGNDSPTDFYAGTLRFDQATANLDLSRELALGLPDAVNVAFGAEYRRDGYGIEAGDEASYKNGGVAILDGPSAGQLAAVGAQVFPGFRPSDAKDVSRHNWAGYVDVEVTPVRGLLLNVAGRFEDYSDFGSTRDGKLAARLQVMPALAVRGAVGTGFRAPSLGQSYFSSTATNFLVINGVNTPVDVRTFPAGSDEAAVLGATPLRPEESVNYSAGFAWEPARELSLTVDAYRIDIDDRIVFSENFTGTAIRQLFEAAGFVGVTGGRFFTNAIDTRTTGVDVVLQYARPVGPGMLRFTGGGNLTKTEVLTDSVVTPPQLVGLGEVLFGRVERGRLERGQPRSSLNLALNYAMERFTFNLNNRRFGEVTVYGAAPADSPTNTDQTFGARWITDVDVSYRVRGGLTAAIGANNVLGVYPEQNFRSPTGADNSNAGIFPYNQVSPFGFNGAFYYVRLSWQGL